MRTPYLAFGRDDQSEGWYGPWWPLFVEDGPHLANSAQEVNDLLRERMALGGETHWVEVAVVPAASWEAFISREGSP